MTHATIPAGDPVGAGAADTPHTWRAEVLGAFVADLRSRRSPFPCTFGAAALERGGLKFAWVEDARDEESLLGLRTALSAYMGTYRTLGKLTSFVAFFRPPPLDRPIAAYEHDFWRVLRFLHRHDPSDWPEDIPTEVEDPRWEFSFCGEPVFVVCNTPAHRQRRSRRSRGMLITFQPRWVFEGLEGHTPRGRAAREVIRRRLDSYDDVPAHASLGNYGEPENREWRQYFLPDADESPPGRCPFHAAARGERSTGGLSHAA